jgi:type VI secretion system protein ImpA
VLDFKTLLAPVTPEQPSGSLLEYDPAFLALLELAKGKPEQRMGESVIPAEPPNWGKVQSGAVALLARTKDLRLASLLVKAELHDGGAAGLFEGLAFTRALLETHWDTLHPQLDPEDDDDPAMRLNVLADLADPDTVVATFRDAEIASARGVGRIRVRDLERPAGGGNVAASSGEPAEGEKAPSIEAVLGACDGAALAKTAEGAASALSDLRAIDAFVRQKVGDDRGPELSKLTALVQLVAKTLSERVGKDGAGGGHEPRAPEDGVTSPDKQAANEGVAAPFVGAIRSRNDVMNALDSICAYYERFEPSSPIPLLLRRSRRLVAMGFLDIVRDLVPEAVPQVEALRGKQE